MPKSEQWPSSEELLYRVTRCPPGDGKNQINLFNVKGTYLPRSLCKTSACVSVSATVSKEK